MLHMQYGDDGGDTSTCSTTPFHTTALIIERLYLFRIV